MKTNYRCFALVAIAGLSIGMTLAAEDDPFKVPRGQLTFDAEGQEGGRFHSRKPHVPSDSSGLTIGRGYDMKFRLPMVIEKQLTDAGLKPEDAKLYSNASKLSGKSARDFRDGNPLVEITPEQQKKLFAISYSEAEMDLMRISNNDDVVTKYGKVDWEKLVPAIRELAVDLRFRGDYTPETRKKFQPLLVRNDLPALKVLMADRDYWKNVPEDRFKRRLDFVSQIKP